MNAKENIILSVVITCFNDGRFLKEALASVEACRKPVYEIIIVNDGSDDLKTLEVLEELKLKGYLIFNQNNQGVSAARNLGLKNAIGKYILTLDADNLIYPEYITKGIEVLEKFPDVGVVYSDLEFFGEETRVVQLPDFDLTQMVIQNYIDACAVFRKTVWEEVGGYNPKLFGYEDWEFWLHIAEKDWKFHHLREVLFRYRKRFDSKVKRSNLTQNRNWLLGEIYKGHIDLIRTALDKTKSELGVTKTELESSKAELEKILLELNGEKIKIQQLQSELDSARTQIHFMENSKFWKLRKISLFLKRFSPFKKQFLFSIDVPSHYCSGGTFKITGWCFSLKGTKPRSIRIRAGAHCFEGVYGLERADVFQIYNQIKAAQNSGFEIEFQLERGQYNFAIDVLDNYGQWHFLTPGIIKPENSAINYVEPGSFRNFFKKIVCHFPILHKILGFCLKCCKQYWRYILKKIFKKPKAVLGLSEQLAPYDAWLKVNQWNQKAKDHLINRLKKYQGHLPKISVVMPVFNPEPKFFELAVKSVLAQVYENWELCLADDKSTDPMVVKMLKEMAVSDCQIKVIFREKNGNISAATNSAASLASGDFLVFLDHDDLLSPDALGEVALYLAANPQTDFLYSDNDKIDEQGRRYNPQFKPDWSPELLLNNNYFCHLIMVRRDLFEKLGGFRTGFEGSQDYDFALRVTEICRKVGHLPLVLYHWRAAPGSTAVTGANKPDSFLAALKALEEAFIRRKINGQVFYPEWAAFGKNSAYDHLFPDAGPAVALIIPTKNQWEILSVCLKSLKKTTYQNYRIYLVDDDSDDPKTIEFLKNCGHQVLKMPEARKNFNYSRLLNFAASGVQEEYLLFLNNDTEVISPRWLSQMVGYAGIPGVGAVGAKLLYPDKTVQHAGVILYLHFGLPGHAFKKTSGDELGYLGFLKLPRNYSAVTGACLLTPRNLFLKVGGFDEQKFPVLYSDVDYCLRLMARGYRSVYCPQAVLFHQESASRGYVIDPEERANFRALYANQEDRYYNPNFSLHHDSFKIQARRIFNGHSAYLKVLMVSNLLDFTGSALQQYEMVLNLASKNLIKPIIFCTQDGPLREFYKKNRIEVIIEKQEFLRDGSFDDYNNFLKKIIDKIKELEVDLIYANTLENFFMVDIAKQLGIPVVWNIHESEFWEKYFENFNTEIKKRALWSFYKAYQVIFVCDQTANLYSALNTGGNFLVIHSAVDLGRFEKFFGQDFRAAARKSLNVQQDEIVILILGTICQRKGQKDLIEAIPYLPEKWQTKIRCFIVGDRPGRYNAELKALIGTFPPEIRSQIAIVPETLDVGQYLAAADIFVCSSRVESFPRVILEAMAFGLPIVTTPVFGIKEQVFEGVNGLYYPPGESKKLAESLEVFLENESLRQKFGKNSLLVLKSFLNFEEMTQAYARIFQEAYLTGIV